MNPKKLEHFLKIAQAGNLSRAAERLNLSQPALSREVRELETTLGVVLFQRHARGVSLTPAGETLRKRSELILSLLNTLGGDVKSTADTPSGRLAFGMPPSMSGSLTGSLIQEFLQQYPDVKLQVRESPSTQLRAALLSREIDFAVLTAQVSEPQLSIRPLLLEPLVLVGPKGAAFAGRRQISLNEAASFPLILPVMPNATRVLIDAAFEKDGRKPRIALETDVAPIAELIARGLGYAVLPASSVSSETLVATSMVHVPIKGLNLTRLLAIPAGVSMSLGAQILTRMLCDRTKALVASKRLRGRYVGP